MCAVAEATARDLISAGVDEKFAGEIAEVIRFKAGFYLPPVHGVLKIDLDPSEMRA